MEVTNPFIIKNETSRYDLYRPKYHYLPFEQINKFIGNKFTSSLDVACGTGHSTIALNLISKKVTGCDLSDEMLKQARLSSSIRFIKADANNLPFEPSIFDFLNISMGFHWVDQKKFLSEASRVLSSGGYLNIDSYGFNGVISEDSSKQTLHKKLFDSRLPQASKRSSYPTNDLINDTDFELVKEIKYSHTLSLNADNFINLIKTWSNYQIQDQKNKNITSKKMIETYNEIFKGKNLPLTFRGKSILYQKKLS